MLVPHPRSFLAFVAECQRVQDEEEALLPTWLRVRPVPLSSFSPWEAGLVTRHARRCDDTLEFARRVAEGELLDLLGLRDKADIPSALLARHAELINFARQMQARAEAVVTPAPDGPKRRDEEMRARMALRPRVVVGLVGLYLGEGEGDATKAAALAREGAPRDDKEGKAQYHHVRRALDAYLRPVPENCDPLRHPFFPAMAGSALAQVSMARRAWERLIAEAGYRQTVNHADRVERAAASGNLASWLLDAGDETDTAELQAAAVTRLCRYFCQRQLAGLKKEAHSRGLDVPSPKSTPRNAKPSARPSASP